ncbi:MAG: sensor histidine kinase, partial [Candidatus Nitrosocosmicus sp.]
LDTVSNFRRDSNIEDNNGIISNNNNNNEKTKLFYGIKEATKAILDFISNADTAIDACLDPTGPSVMMGVDAIKNERLKAKRRGVNFRYITEITKDNLSYCKELSEFAEVRHLNGVKGNFEISKIRIKGEGKGEWKGEYIATATLQEAEPVTQLIYSNVKEIVEQEQFVFDTLWNKAIPFLVRIKEIEEGIKPEVIEIIADPKEALETEYRLLKSAKQEVQIIFSTINTFLLQERQLGITKVLSNLSKQGVRTRILTPMDIDVKELTSNLKKQYEQEIYQKKQVNKNNNDNNNNADICSAIDIQEIAPSSSINAKIIIVDKQDSLAMEIKDGTRDDLYNTIGLTTYSNSKSTIASYCAIVENLYEQNQLYMQLRDAYQRVENTNSMQREFINVAAHELRTPIQSVLGYTELLLEGETDDRKKQALIRILHQSERLRKLASDILDVARIEGKTFRLTMKPLNLNSAIANIIKDYVNRLENYKSHEITAKKLSNVNVSNDDKRSKYGKTMITKLLFKSKLKDEEHVFIDADKERLTQVIDNILDNAFKFTDAEGSVTVTLVKQEAHSPPRKSQLEDHIEQRQRDLGQQKQQQYANIIIRDTGTGIDPQILPRLFSKFATKSHRGTGLGLHISKNIIEAHGGKIWAENNGNGKGATFTIALPLLSKHPKW